MPIPQARGRRRSLCIVFDLAPPSKLLLSPPWGRGWPAAGAFFSRGGPGEGGVSLFRDFDLNADLKVGATRKDDGQ
jgi:hypothetical protein